MLVGDEVVVVPKVPALAGAQHGLRERGHLGGSHPIDGRGHEERAHLIVGNLAAHVALDEPVDLRGLERSAAPFAVEEVVSAEASHERGSIADRMRAVVLLSGGLDSATVLAIARSEKRECLALSLVYGQRHGIELAAARRVAAAIGAAEHVEYRLDLRVFGASALTADIDVPKNDLGRPGIPVTYVPARNTMFLAIALAYPEPREAAER